MKRLLAEEKRCLGIMDLISLAMLAASIASEFLGAHGIFAAFLAGVILSLRRSRGYEDIGTDLFRIDRA
jgi:Kef-type K+ transport system membrane component KefB